MRAGFVGAIALAGLATNSVARAADFEQPVPPLTAAVAPQQKLGRIDFYAGVVGGWSMAESAHRFVDGTVDTGDFNVQGALVGGTLGASYSTGSWYLALENDLSESFVDGSAKIAGGPFSTRLRWLYDFRAKIGYEVGAFVPYFALGPAIGSVQSTERISGTGTASSVDTRSGWSLGVGVNYNINPNFTAFAEYLFICLGSSTQFSIDNVSFMGNFWRAGLNYNFNSFGVRTARDDNHDFPNRTGAAYDWTGLYVGFVSGGSSGQQSTKYDLSGVAAGSAYNTTNGGFSGIGYHGLAGIEAGYNWQVGRLVFGFETDFQFTQLGGKTVNTHSILTSGGLTGTLDSSADMALMGTIRGRVGIAMDRWLFFSTAGLAYGEVETSSNFSVPGFGSVASTSESTPLGWVAGFGFETALWEKWTVKTDMLYVDLSTRRDTFAGIGPFGPITARSHVSDFVWRGALNTQFDWFGSH